MTTLHLCRVAAALVTEDEERLRDQLHRALDAGVSVIALREVVLTAYLFDGYPAALEGFRVLAGIVGPPYRTPADTTYTTDSIARWRSRGEQLCRTVYGPQFKKLTGYVAEIAPELADAMIVEGYGKVLARDGLDPRLRELAVVAILAAKNRPRQLLSHCLGALRLGATEGELREALDAADEYAPADNIARSEPILTDAIRRFVKS